MKPWRWTILLSLTWLMQECPVANGCDPKPSFKTQALELPYVASLLGWVHTDNNLCGGYYLESDLNPQHQPIVPMSSAISTLHYDQAILQNEKPSVFTGHVSVAQPGRLIQADYMKVKLNKQHKAQKVLLRGHVRLQESGHLFTGERGEMYLHKHTATLEHSHYHLAMGANTDSCVQHAFGYATHIDELDKKHFLLHHASFSTCSPENTTWHTEAATLDLNQVTGRATATHSWLYWRSAKVFYFPWLYFPIDKRRQSGFLIPKFSSSSTNGYMLEIPYYFNFAPNYDLTFTPKIMPKRGLDLEAQFRYLTETRFGRLNGSILPKDSAFRAFQTATPAAGSVMNPFFMNRLTATNSNRAAISWRDDYRFNDHWKTAINYNWVSDDYFFSDLATLDDAVFGYDAKNQLSQFAGIYFEDKSQSATLSLQRYQTLQPYNQYPTVFPYNRLPELNWQGSFIGKTPLSLDWQIQDVQFQLSPIQPGSTTPSVTGNRLFIMPTLTYAFHRPQGYITPQIRLPITQYHLNQQLVGRANHITRVLPAWSLDTGLYFDRTVTDRYRQTLEPRLFFLYVPFHEQNEIPVFESNVVNTAFSGMFNYNRFSSIDRIGDTKQVTASFTSRLLDSRNGLEKIKASVGQEIYTGSRRITNCTYPGCETDSAAPNLIGNRLQLGLTAADLTYQITPQWNTHANVGYQSQTKQIVSANMGLHYWQNPSTLFETNYSVQNATAYQLDSLGQVQNQVLHYLSASAVLPVWERWQLVLTAQRNLKGQFWQDYLSGIEYNSCCYAFRIVVGRVNTVLNQTAQPLYDRRIYFQLQLKGLGTMGTDDPSSILRQYIPRYMGLVK